MEDKSFQGMVKHMQSLGIVDQDYADQLLAQDLPYDSMAICVTFTKHEDRRVDYIFAIEKDRVTDQCEIRGCEAKMIGKPEIVHGVFNGIDTRELEDRFSMVDWNRNLFPMPMDGESIANIFADLILLSKSKYIAAHDVAERLMVKYWTNTPLDRIFILSADLDQYEKKLRFPIRMDSNDLDDDQVYNLLSGRSVIKFDIREGLQTSAYWLKEEQGELLLFYDFDLAGRLNALPFAEPINDVRKLEIFYDLLDGNRLSIPLKIGGKVIPTFIEADPVDARIAVYDKDMKLINDVMLKHQAETKRIPKAIRPVPRKPRKGKGL